MNNSRLIKIVLIAPLIFLSAACQDYLDVVPDNVPTMEHAFANRNEAEKALFTCYSFLPNEANPDYNPAFNAGDEVWTYWPMTEDYFSLDSYNIARGLQNKATPLMNYWDGFNGRSMWQGIRMCNIFIENIDNVPDIADFEKQRWIAEAKFLKAYFHWYLFRMYGPIPIADENLVITADPEEVKVVRQPVDSVVNYIASLLDEAAGDGFSGLPSVIDSRTTELGRVTSVAALAIKARVLVTAASPLFNGNTDFQSLENPDGTALFNSTYDPGKWERAAEACRVAVVAAEEAGVQLYTFSSSQVVLNDAQKQEMSIRSAVTEKWNSELIWGATNDDIDNARPSYWIQLFACPQLDPGITNLSLKGKFAPTLKMAELFYTANGVPIDEDKTWDYADRYQLRTTTSDDVGMQPNYQTVGMHFDREPRFYASIAFDGSTWLMRNGTYNIQSKLGQHSAKRQSRLYSVTGYFTKKVVNWNLVATSSAVTVEPYPWPIIRLADLYLLYAEALNESGQSSEALVFINKVRERAGLRSVEHAWSEYSTNPSKYTTVVGLRSIIQQERGIELAFEGSRFWDLRRWKTATRVLNAPIYGWDIEQSTYEAYNRRILLFRQSFDNLRDYLWPIHEHALQINPNLAQNPGW
ncbi:hypothetical protein GCM10007415_16160 [Parapedobacter pyrenivorans]|uniref:Starch-binding associating with outer membrane n=1 Tax=Parapedobacter pyrenivorans TaxID=1305674 RepID=A0A917HMQ8_9SPHI|nr:RagB/SusD family nutrient uptake outer membrane protein [Parapedobacter pyrenivorans]GGG83829.1 hypothetical protein GCM10007415_16160 [Parapedobacter pyrenivorans]